MVPTRGEVHVGCRTRAGQIRTDLHCASRAPKDHSIPAAIGRICRHIEAKWAPKPVLKGEIPYPVSTLEYAGLLSGTVPRAIQSFAGRDEDQQTRNRQSGAIPTVGHVSSRYDWRPSLSMWPESVLFGEVVDGRGRALQSANPPRGLSAS